MSGIEIDSEIPSLFNDIKLRSTNKWVSFEIQNKKKIVVSEKGEKAVTEDKEDDRVQFEQLKGKLDPAHPRYILYDFGFTNKEGRKIKKIAFIFW